LATEVDGILFLFLNQSLSSLFLFDGGGDMMTNHTADRNYFVSADYVGSMTAASYDSCSSFSLRKVNA
jgi:hypothetical protein